MISNDPPSRRDTEPASLRDVLVLICTYNERDNLPTLVAQVFQTVPDAQILVVDDGSPDGTFEWVVQQREHNPSVHGILRPKKQGLGTAIRTGMMYAIEHQYSWLVNLDGDLSHNPADMASMLQLRGRCDLAIGSRYIQGGGMRGCSWRRVFVSRCANVLARVICGWKIQDCSSAYRMYRVALLQTIPLDRIQARGYGFLEEVLAMILRAGGRVVETPIVYTERTRGASKLSLREAFSTFFALLRVGRIARKKNRSTAAL
ncbi:MAG: polyprenol monophosphomannose synthase [Planctomycetota bacterium]